MQMTSRSVAVAAVFVSLMLYGCTLAAQPGPDAAVIEQLRTAGSDLSKPHFVEFYLYVPTQAAAERVATRVRDMGCDVSRVDAAALGPGWLVLATKTLIPSESAMVELRRQFDLIVTAENGEYDGWETQVVK